MTQEDHHEIQLVQYHRGLEKRLAELPPTAETPTAVETLGDRIERTGVADRSTRDGDLWRLVVGVGYKTLEAVSFEIGEGTNVIISGASGAGKTETLRRIMVELLSAKPETQVLVVSRTVEEWPNAVDRFSRDMVSPDRPTFVLVDDVRSVSAPAQQRQNRRVEDTSTPQRRRNMSNCSSPTRQLSSTWSTAKPARSRTRRLRKLAEVV